MRIRKHAARILSSLSINPTQTLAAAAAAAGGRELEMHVCQLNQSPWDAMAFTPPGSVSFFPYQELEEVQEDNGFAWSGHTEEQEAAAAAVSDVSGITAAESNSWRRTQVKVEVMAEQAAAEGERREWRSDYSYAKKRSTSSCCISNITKKTKRKSTTSSHASGAADVEKVEIKVLENIIPPPAAAAATCKKNDGKGWHCKRPAQHPHSLCEYHLNQVRSYYGNGVGTGHHRHQQQQQLQQQALPKAQDAALIPDKKKKNKKNKTTTTAKKGSSCSSRGRKSSDGAGGRRRPWRTEADFFYYYSGFGPWRGKRRCCGGADHSDRGGRRWSSSNVVDASVDGDYHEQRDAIAEAGPPDHGARSPSPAVHDQAPDDLDDDDEDVDGGDGAGSRDGGDDVAAGRRRARKPIKARSLKSLL